jgi:hypothetical protein
MDVVGSGGFLFATARAGQCADVTPDDDDTLSRAGARGRSSAGADWLE